MCPNCSTPIRGADSEFCTNCGTRVRPAQFQGETAPAEPVPVPSAPAVPRSASAFAFDLKRLGLADRIIGGTGIVTLLSVFLPWFGVLGFSISGVSLHGYLVIALLADLLTLGYLALRAGWDTLPFKLPIAHAPVLLITTGVQLLFMLIAFLQPDGLSHEFGSYLGLLAALVACAVIALPAIQAVLSNDAA